MWKLWTSNTILFYSLPPPILTWFEWNVVGLGCIILGLVLLLWFFCIVLFGCLILFIFGTLCTYGMYMIFWQIFDKFLDEFLLTIASFRIEVPSIFFSKIRLMELAGKVKPQSHYHVPQSDKISLKSTSNGECCQKVPKVPAPKKKLPYETERTPLRPATQDCRN